ncbi:MAG: 30S ribosomal protein S6 [Simkaniaceae bacterium]
MSKESKQLYEGMFIISAQLSDEARQKALDRITGSIESRGGEIHKIHDWGRRKLAYTIEKRRDGYYYIIYFSLGAKAVKEIWYDYHLNEDLIRFMTLKAEKVEEKIEFKPLVQA